MLFCPLLIFFKINFFKKKSFRNSIRVSGSLDPDQAGHFIEPDLGRICLQWLSAADTSRARIFLLVDLQEFFFRFRVGGGGRKKKKKKSSENDQSIIKK